MGFLGEDRCRVQVACEKPWVLVGGGKGRSGASLRAGKRELAITLSDHSLTFLAWMRLFETAGTLGRGSWQLLSVNLHE